MAVVLVYRAIGFVVDLGTTTLLDVDKVLDLKNGRKRREPLLAVVNRIRGRSIPLHVGAAIVTNSMGAPKLSVGLAQSLALNFNQA